MAMPNSQHRHASIAEATAGPTRDACPSGHDRGVDCLPALDGRLFGFRLLRVLISQRWRWARWTTAGGARGNRSPAPSFAGMTYVVDVKDPLNEGSLDDFPVTLADEAIREWWAGLCRGPVTDLPTADEVALEYATRYGWGGSVAVIHRDGKGRLIDSSLFAREIR
jgi:hypothetical protein